MSELLFPYTKKVLRGWRWKRRDYVIEQRTADGLVADTIRTCSALRALRKVALEPDAVVRVYVPQIVHSRRAS